MSAQARKSPLRASQGTGRATTLRAIPQDPDTSEVRQATAQDYATHLRATNNKHGEWHDVTTYAATAPEWFLTARPAERAVWQGEEACVPA